MKRIFVLVVLALLAFGAKARSQDRPKDSSPPSATSVSAEFTVQDADDLMAQLRQALDGHSERKMLALFDRDRMTGYVSFRDQVDAFLKRYETFRVNIRVTQVTSGSHQASFSAAFTLEATPIDGVPTRREETVRFEVERTKNGWRVVDLNPRSFFS